MESYREIVLESSLILVVFYLGYILFFSRETTFRQNRIYLLSGIFLSFTLPLVQFPVPVDYQIEALIKLKAVEVLGSGKQVLAERSYFSINGIVIVIYLLGVLFLSLRFLYHLWIISKFWKNSTTIKSHYGKIVYTGKRHPVFSFMNCIFVDSKTETSKELNVILEHERVHIDQLHSFDLFLLELLVIVQWFNPIAWLYRKIIKQNHEYLADRGVLKGGFSVDTYQHVLLSNYSEIGFGFANSFNHYLTFKRLIMMKKINSNKLSAFKLLIIVPMLLLSGYFVSCSKEQDQKDNLQNTDSKTIQSVEDKNNLIPPPPPPPPVLNSEQDKKSSAIGADENVVIDASAIKDKPEFPGGEQALIKFIAENTIYPKEVMEKGIQGTIYVRFIVKKDGSVQVSEIVKRPNIANDPSLEIEAARVVGSLPNWKPGTIKGQAVNVSFIIPIQFNLQ